MQSQKSILIIEPATSGLELLRIAKSMGYTVFALTANTDERIVPEPYKDFIHKCIEVDTNCINDLIKITLDLQKKHSFSAVIPGFEIFVAHAARLANLIGVPGIPVETGDALRDKNKMRNALKNAGVASPEHTVLHSLSNIENVADMIKFPCVIKPLDQSGSIHVSKANNLNELTTAYQALCEDKWTEMAKGVGTIAIVEEYIDGTEFSVEGFVDETGSHIVSITEKLTKGEPFFVEMGHIVSAKIDSSIREAIMQYMQQVVKALHINLGVYHAELKINKHGPVLIEIAGRLAGDKICNLILLSTGVNLFQIMLESHLGHPIKLDAVTIKQYAGIRYFSPIGLKTYSTITGIDELKSLTGYHDFKLLINPGQIIPPLANFMGRAAYCIFTAPTYEELKLTLDFAEKVITFS